MTRLTFRLAGNLLLTAGLVGGLVAFGTFAGFLDVAPVEGGLAAPPTGDQPLPITRVVLPRIQLASEVVPARSVERDDESTWEVPAFTIGHAQSTAGAGEPGNAVLLGHATSKHAGNVFQDLHLVEPGDVVQIFSGTRQFDYQVAEVRMVPRTDTSVLQPTEAPSVTLITCAGIWLPFIWDYTERLVVRAELKHGDGR